MVRRTPLQTPSEQHHYPVTRSTHIKNPYRRQNKMASTNLLSCMKEKIKESPITPVPFMLNHISGTFRGQPISPTRLSEAEQLLSNNLEGNILPPSSSTKKHRPSHFSQPIPKTLDYDEGIVNVCLSSNQTKEEKKISLATFNSVYGPIQSNNSSSQYKLNSHVRNITSNNARLLRFRADDDLPWFFFENASSVADAKSCLGAVFDLRKSLLQSGCENSFLADP